MNVRSWRPWLCLCAISLGGCDIQILNPQGEDPAVQENEGLFPPQVPQGSDSSPTPGFAEPGSGLPSSPVDNVPAGPAPTSAAPTGTASPGVNPGLPDSPNPSVPLEPAPGPAPLPTVAPLPEDPEPDNAGGAPEEVDGGLPDGGVLHYSVTDAGVDLAE